MLQDGKSAEQVKKAQAQFDQSWYETKAKIETLFGGSLNEVLDYATPDHDGVLRNMFKRYFQKEFTEPPTIGINGVQSTNNDETKQPA